MLCRNRISMLTGFGMYKRAFYTPEHNAKWDPKESSFEGLEMQSWNIPTDWAQQADEKNWVSCQVIVFILGVMVTITLKLASFLYLLLMATKKQSRFEQNI